MERKTVFKPMKSIKRISRSAEDSATDSFLEEGEVNVDDNMAVQRYM